MDEPRDDRDDEIIDEVIGDEVDWQVDDDGTEFFVDEDGVRWDLADDGYAYPREPDEPGGAAADAPPAEDAPDGAAANGEDDTADVPVADLTEAADTQATTVRGRDEPARPVGGDGASADDVLLVLDDLKSGYGNLPVLHGVSFSVRRGETAVLLGLNGAGKTTTALNVCGSLAAWGGAIRFDGQDATGWATRDAVANGIVLVPEGRRVFGELTVERNLQVGAWSQRGNGDWFAEQRDRVFDYFPRLRERRSQLAGTLSGGEQQMLAIGRGLMANPRLLIIDEASMGLAPVIVKDVFDIVAQINDDGVTVMMIEQNVGALDVADVGLVMEQGHIVRELRGDDVRDRSLVAEVLMG